MVFESIKGMFKKGGEDTDYVEIDIGKEAKKAKVLIKPFVLKKFEDVNEVLNYLREGYTIAIIDIKPLKSKDIIEVKRAIAKLKKTADALEGSIAGFGDGIVIVTPQFAEIAKASGTSTDVNVNVKESDR
ncbi:MAG: cell division protein SepF [Nanoarchaeota archaeon]